MVVVVVVFVIVLCVCVFSLVFCVVAALLFSPAIRAEHNHWLRAYLLACLLARLLAYLLACLLATCLPLACHLLATCLPLACHLLATCLPLACHLLACRARGRKQRKLLKQRLDEILQYRKHKSATKLGGLVRSHLSRLGVLRSAISWAQDVRLRSGSEKGKPAVVREVREVA